MHKNVTNLVVETVSELDFRVKNYSEKNKRNGRCVHACMGQVAGACLCPVAGAWVACVSSGVFFIGGFYDPDNMFL